MYTDIIIFLLHDMPPRDPQRTSTPRDPQRTYRNAYTNKETTRNKETNKQRNKETNKCQEDHEDNYD